MSRWRRLLETPGDFLKEKTGNFYIQKINKRYKYNIFVSVVCFLLGNFNHGVYVFLAIFRCLSVRKFVL